LGGSWFKVSLGKKFMRAPSQPMDEHGDKHLSSSLCFQGKHKIGGLWFRLVIKKNPTSKITNAKGVEGVAQGVESLPNKREALSSTPSTSLHPQKSNQTKSEGD
jgi:hypothetical protein